MFTTLIPLHLLHPLLPYPGGILKFSVLSVRTAGIVLPGLHGSKLVLDSLKEGTEIDKRTNVAVVEKVERSMGEFLGIKSGEEIMPYTRNWSYIS